MKVLYNVSPLGMMHYKTGCFRVTECVAEELAIRDDVDLRFCSNSILSTAKALDYTTKVPALAEVKYSIPRLSGATKKIVGIHSDLADVINQQKINNVKKFVLRGERKLFRLVSQKIYNLKGENIFLDVDDLKTASVYHTASDPIPKVIGDNKKIQSFYTSYDLIPVLFPEMSGGFIDYFNLMLNSLTRESWILCISHSCRNDLLNHMGDKIDPNKVFVTQLAASNIFYKSSDKVFNNAVKAQYGIPDAPYILSVCTLDRRKNLTSVIQAFAEIVNQEHISDLNLVLVGEKGASYDKIMQEIEHHSDLKNRIFITGSVPDEHLAPLYTEAMMFVYPSLYEGFGLPPLEAMQCGTPVITSNVSSLPEVVGDAGIMISPMDINALAASMFSIYKDSTFRGQLKERSLERAKLFSWKKCADDTINAYKRSLE